jgi:hypothetical protein
MPRQTLSSPIGKYKSIDDVLGPRETRFFGDGFRRVRHEIRDIAVSPGPDGRASLAARARIIHPDVWSRKGSMDQRPHLSTIDVLVIAAQLSEVLLARELRLSPAQRRIAILRAVRIKAGRSPVEQEMGDLALTARFLEDQDDPRSARKSMTICTVGNLRAECEVIHPAGEGGSPGHDEVAAAYAGDLQPGVYSGGFRKRRQLLEDIEADFSENRARARLRTTFLEGTPARREGLDASLYFAASAVDCFAATLQLGQLLLYQLDGVPRELSNTLWMRDTAVELDPSRGRLAAESPVTASLERLRLLENSKGETWRTSDIVGELHGTKVRCSVAHRIPKNIQKGIDA